MSLSLCYSFLCSKVTIFYCFMLRRCLSHLKLSFNFILNLPSYDFLAASHSFLMPSYGFLMSSCLFLSLSYGFLALSYCFLTSSCLFLTSSYGFLTLSHDLLTGSCHFPDQFSLTAGNSLATEGKEQ